jgi:hypothetical protein
MGSMAPSGASSLAAAATLASGEGLVPAEKERVEWAFILIWAREVYTGAWKVFEGAKWERKAIREVTRAQLRIRLILSFEV